LHDAEGRTWWYVRSFLRVASAPHKPSAVRALLSTCAGTSSETGTGECLVDAGMYFARAWQHGYGRAVDDPDSKVHILMEVLADGYSLMPIRVEKVRSPAGNSFSRLGMGVRVEI
jgi:hypothetical protein